MAWPSQDLSPGKVAPEPVLLPLSLNHPVWEMGCVAQSCFQETFRPIWPHSENGQQLKEGKVFVYRSESFILTYKLDFFTWFKV